MRINEMSVKQKKVLLNKLLNGEISSVNLFQEKPFIILRGGITIWLDEIDFTFETI